MSDSSNGTGIEIWLRMYEEQVRHARHHEVLRTQSTNVIIAISAALIAFVSTDSGSDNHSAVGVFVLVLNLYGLLMSLKHYERSRLHVTVGGRYRDVISDASSVQGKKINDARKIAREEHKPKTLVKDMRAYVLWCGLHLIVALIGVLIASGVFGHQA